MKYGIGCAMYTELPWESRNVAVKVMPPNLLCWPMMSEVGASGTAVVVESSSNILLRFVAV